MTLNSPVRHSSRLDQWHWTHGCRRLTVCNVVRPSCWLWRTEDRHDDLQTQWQAYTAWFSQVRWSRVVFEKN